MRRISAKAKLWVLALIVARHILSQFPACYGETERRTKAWCWVSRSSTVMRRIS